MNTEEMLRKVLVIGVAGMMLGGCGASEAQRARVEQALEVSRGAIVASREGRLEHAARGFAVVWREACGPEGPASEGHGTYVMAQHEELREAFRSEEGRPHAMKLLKELAVQASGPDATTRASAGLARLAAIMGEPGIVAKAVEARERAGLGMSTVRPVIGILIASGRQDLAAKVEPSAARRAAESVGDGIATAGLVVATAPVTVPMAIIATSGPTDFEHRNTRWVDPVRREDW
jgi:hypothetical protein